MKMPKPIREMCLLQSAPLIKAVGNAQPKKTEWQCLTELMEEQNTVSKAVARIDKSAPKTTSSVVCRKCNMFGRKVVDCLKNTNHRANTINNQPGGQQAGRQVRQPSMDPVHSWLTSRND